MSLGKTAQLHLGAQREAKQYWNLRLILATQTQV